MIILLESALCGNISTKLSAELKTLFSNYHLQQYETCYPRAVELFNGSKIPEEKAFYLHFICILTEIKYDLVLRQLWMKKWNELIAEFNCQYVKNAKLYHSANTYYFDSSYNEASIRYKELTQSPYVNIRFKALAHYHLGLIYLHRQLFRGAKIEFELAENLAVEINHLPLQKRINHQLNLVQHNQIFSLLDLEIVQLLLAKNIKEAKANYLKKKKEYRKQNFSRFKNSNYGLLPAFAATSGKNIKHILSLINLIDDPNIRIQSITLIQQLGFQFAELKNLLNDLTSDLRVIHATQELTPITINAKFARSSQNTEFLGVSLAHIQSDDLLKFTQCLLSETQVTKEKICLSVWNLPYDPIIHDGKIYKLIYKFRNYFGKKDLIVNHYGKYAVNQKYCRSN